MLKRIIFSVVLLLVFFAGTAHAQIINIPFKPPSSDLPEFVPGELIITYQKGESPKQLEEKIKLSKKETSSLWGQINYQFQVFTGSKKPISFYEEELNNIQKSLKDAGVIKAAYLDTPWGTTTSKANFKKGADLKKAIKILKKLPQIQNVDYNYYRYTSKISSESGIVPNKFIIEYKEGSTPEDLILKVEERKKILGGFLGQARIAAEDLGNRISNESPPEEQLERINEVANDIGRENEKPLIPDSSLTNSEALKNTFVITTDGSRNITETLMMYRSLPEVKNIRSVGKIYATETPNDPEYPQMWGLPKIEAPTAWDKSKGSKSVTVAVIDSGVDYSHPDLAENVTKGPNYFSGGDDPMDDCGHGTHVAGTIGAITNNSVGVAGINWKVNILAIKVMGPVTDKCAGEDANIALAIAYASSNGAKVINMSLGGLKNGECPFDIQQAITSAKNNGVSVVVASGNSNADSSNIPFGNCHDLIVVSATGPDDKRANYSNFGSVVSIAAPGGQPSPLNTCSPQTCILSTDRQSGESTYSSRAGTSMAAPHVAGAAALLLSIDSSITPDQIKNILASSADVIETDKPIGPRLNLAKAVELVSGPGGRTTTPTPTGSSTTPTPFPSDSPTSPTPSPTSSTAPTVTPGPTSSQNGNVAVSVKLPGIGAEGNQNPVDTSFQVTLSFTGENGSLAGNSNGTLNYKDGIFSGNIPFELPSGIYQIKLKTDGALDKIVPGFYQISSSSNVTLPQVTLSSGDVNNDKILDVLDYNIFVNCIRGQKGCVTTSADLNLDGSVNEADLNIFLRQLANRRGD